MNEKLKKLCKEFRGSDHDYDDSISERQPENNENLGYEGCVDFVLEYIIERKTIPDLISSIIDGR